MAAAAPTASAGARTSATSAGDDVPAYAAPARADDLAGLPPTLVVVGALDGFVDEDVDYALRLNRAGVPTELHVYPGACHGFEGIAAGAAVSRRAQADIDTWLARGPATLSPGRSGLAEQPRSAARRSERRRLD